LWAWSLAWIFARWFEATRGRAGGWKALYLLSLGAILIHIAGDWITQFGTMLLAPLSDARFGLGAVFIIDLAFSGILVAGLMLGAVYMATDMVTSPVTNVGRWIFGAGVGVLVVIIRIWGGLPEAVMYAILIMNALVPFLNRATEPRVFGTRLRKAGA